MIKPLLKYFGLFASLSTLVCCALPTLLVSLGLGASMISLTNAIPQMIWIGEHKVYIFITSFILLSLSSFLAYRNRNAPCPIDPDLRDACIRGRKYTKTILIVSWIVLVTGFSFSYLAEYIF